MNLTLLDGHYRPEDARTLITELLRVKIAFHQRRIEAHKTEEDIKHSEKRIRELEASLQAALRELRDATGWIDMRAIASIEVNPPR
jgi:hypothetical protein